MWQQGLMKKKIDCIESCSDYARPLWVQMPRQQVAYGYFGCGAMDILGTNFLAA